jgi:ribosomal protein L12E/L44/L45/RPP1/RPP2
MSNIVQASYRVEVDASKVNALLAALNDKEAKKAIKSGIRKAALIIRKQAQTNLVSAIPATNTPGH